MPMRGRTDYGRDVHGREADERYERLVADLASTCELLTTYGESHWLAWMETVRGEIRDHDAHGLTRLLEAYGGMSSFNDVYLNPPDPQVASETDRRRDHDLFEESRSRMWADATALLQALDRDR